MDVSVEVERKYDPGSQAALPDLRRLRGVAEIADGEVRELEAVYFDTSDLALARVGLTLRRRTSAGDQGWHLKLPAGDGRREEVRLPLGRATKNPPQELRAATSAVTRGRRLAPVTTLRTSRTVRRVLADDGTCLAEVCEDEVHAFDGSSSATLLAWREWKVELVDGDEDLLERVDTLMDAHGVAPAAHASALARVLGERVAPTSPAAPPRPKGPVGTVLQARLAEQVDALKRRDVEVRLDLEDGVHQMRVAMRRLRSALATFRPLLDRAATDPVREELKRVADLLGGARDAEVLAERLVELVAAQPVELVMGTVTSRIEHALGDRYREARAKAIEAMEAQRYFDLLDQLESLVADPPLTDRAEERAKDALPGLLGRDAKRLRKRVAAVGTATDQQDRDTLLHESRKAAKRLRYAAEASRPVLGKDARRVARAAKSAQKVLGEHQDSVVARQVLRELGVQAHLDGDSAFTFGVLLGGEQQRAEARATEFLRTWKADLAPRLGRAVR